MIKLIPVKETEEKLVKYVKKHRPSDTKIKPYEPNSNFPEINAVTKIHALDAIINHAKDVCGPYGGIYGDLTPVEMMGGAVVKDSFYTKSKDGYSFFKTLKFGHRHAETVKVSIAQLGKYIASYEGETSRDGTTSVAVVGCGAAKGLLINRLDKPQIPSTWTNIVFDILSECGSEIIEKYKVPIYKDSHYLGDGKKFAINAISTTVDGNGLFIEAFENLMNEADGKYDLKEAFKSSLTRKNGAPRLELDIIPGIKFRAQCLNENFAGGFLRERTSVFILDGFISRHQAVTFKHHLMQWLVNLLQVVGPDRKSIYDPTGAIKMAPPLLIVTRTPDYIQRLFEEIMSTGIKVLSGNSWIVIHPKIMIGNNVEGQEVHFNDMREVFSENVIDLDLMNQYMKAKRTTPMEPDVENGGLIKNTGATEIDLSPLFPKMTQTGDAFEKSEIEIEGAFDRSRGDKQDLTILGLRKTVFSTKAIMIESSYDGVAMYLTPETDDQLRRVKEKRELLFKMRDSFDPNSMEATTVHDRIAFFSGLSIKPTIYSRGDDEYQQMFSIYEDALGVFESIHLNGVMCGSNSFMLKHIQELSESYFNRVNEFMDRMKIENDDIRFRYTEFARDILDSVLFGYQTVLQILTGEDYETVLDEYLNNEDVKNNTLKTYNVVTGDWSEKIVEAARTTADVFVGALAIAKDMLMLKRIRIVPEAGDHIYITRSNEELPLHTKYKTMEETENE